VKVQLAQTYKPIISEIPFPRKRKGITIRLQARASFHRQERVWQILFGLKAEGFPNTRQTDGALSFLAWPLSFEGHSLFLLQKLGTNLTEE
jgi:hypothetical protein